MNCLSLLFLAMITACSSPAGNDSHDAGKEAKSTEQGHTEQAKSTETAGIIGDVRSSLCDKAGNLWFGTTGHGLYRLSPAANGESTGRITHFTEQHGLSNKAITCLLEDHAGKIWVGTETGLFRYDPSENKSGSNGNFTLLPLPVSKAQNVNPFPEKTIDPTQNDVRSLLQDRNGKLWIGTGRDGVYWYDGKLVTHFLHNDGVANPEKLRLESVNSMAEDQKGNIWFATWFEGLCRFDGASITSFKPNNEVWYQTLLVDKQGNLWISRRQHGVCRYDGKAFTNVLQHGTLDSCFVGPQLQDKRGNIWFISSAADLTRRDITGGLWRYDPSAASKKGASAFTNFGPRDGLDSYTITTAVEDRSGVIWVSAKGKGLYRFDGRNFIKYSS